MKNMIKQMKEKRWLHYIFIIIIGLLASIPLLWVQLKNTNDGWLHLIRLLGLDAAITEGNFPFLVFPHLCKDFGYSMTAFYPPLVTYIPYIFGVIAQSFSIGLKLFASLTIILSGIFMYNFMYEVTKKKGIAFFSAVIYMIFPYHHEAIFYRFAIGEFTAFVFIPIVFQGLYNLLHGDRKKHFYIAIGATGLILCHTISTVYTALFCIIYILFNIKKFWNKEVIKKCAINVVFILLMAAMFLIPMLEFKSQAQYSIFMPDVMKTSGQYTQVKGLQLCQFVKDIEENGVSFIIGIPITVLLLLSLFAYSKISKKYKDFYIINWILGAVSLFMTTRYFPWYYMPDFLNTIQYPWRMMGFAFFFWSTVCAINLYYVVQYCKKEWLRNGIYILSIIILLVFMIGRFQYYPQEDTTIDQKYEQDIIDKNLEISHFSVNRDYLPYKALIKQFDYLEDREDRIYILSGAAYISNEQKYGLSMSCQLENVTKDTQLELPYFFYPGYTVILETEGSQIQLPTYESDNGFLTIQIGEGIQRGNLIVEYTGTTLEKVSYFISLLGVIGFIYYVYKEKRKEAYHER